MKTITIAILFSVAQCKAVEVDWWALHQVEGCPAANQVGCSGDLGFYQISPPVWSKYARTGEKWWIEVDNRVVAQRVMEARFIKLRICRNDLNDFQVALVWFSPSARLKPNRTQRDYATRYSNLCQNHK
jgi:hypothetical protein